MNRKRRKKVKRIAKAVLKIAVPIAARKTMGPFVAMKVENLITQLLIDTAKS